VAAVSDYMLGFPPRSLSDADAGQEGPTQTAPQGDAPESVIVREVVMLLTSVDPPVADPVPCRLHFASRVHQIRRLRYEIVPLGRPDLH
jgi:hypothetical protein